MNNLPPYLAALLADGQLGASQLSVRSQRLLKPLFDGAVLERQAAGRGERVVVRNAGAFQEWLACQFPVSTGDWNHSPEDRRAGAIVQGRDSKAAKRSVAQGVLHLRGFRAVSTQVLVDGRTLPVGELTAQHGLAAVLIHETSLCEFTGSVALVENLELFLRLEAIAPEIEVTLNSAGRISDRLIACLARSLLGPQPLLHFPDYDPVGLSDYLRLHAALGDRVRLFCPPDLEERFKIFGNKKLLTKKRRNRELFTQLGAIDWPCSSSAEVFHLIKETGSGLEQEALLLSKNNLASI